MSVQRVDRNIQRDFVSRSVIIPACGRQEYLSICDHEEKEEKELFPLVKKYEVELE
ncbi:MAG: hypothetical protein ABH952_06025 [Candidatus Omnitrophota bacterium]